MKTLSPVTRFTTLVSPVTNCRAPASGSTSPHISAFMIRKLKSGEFRLYSRKKNPATGKRRNLGTFSTLAKARQHEREVQYFKRH